MQSYIENLDVYINKKKILSDISFPLKNGITGIIGKNGAGKTTLLKAIAGINVKAQGKLVLSGNDVPVHSFSKARLFAYVPQNYNYDIHITALEFALLGRAVHLSLLKIPSVKDRLIARKAFEKLDASHLIYRHFDTLSGGEKKLCCLAKAICTGAQTALLDEPCADLDFGRQHEFLSLLRSGLFKKVLVSIHSPDLALKYCDRILVIDNGKMSDFIEMDKSEESYVRLLKALKSIYGEKTDFIENNGEKNIIWRN